MADTADVMFTDNFTLSTCYKHTNIGYVHRDAPCGRKSEDLLPDALPPMS